MYDNKISVIVPVYNIGQYLESSIKSLINQTYRNIEIILVDDGSVDNSPAICDLYAEKDNRIKVIHQKQRCLCGKKRRDESSNRRLYRLL